MGYYFESRGALLQAVIASHVEVLTATRISALEEFTGTAESSLSRIVDAYIDPYLALLTDRDIGWRHYGRLIAALAQ